MQYSLKALALLAISGLAVAQIPSCAQPAIDAATKSVCNGCATDYTCACANQAAIQSAATSGVIAACGAETALNDVLPAAKALCENPPPDVSCSSTEPSSSKPAPESSTTEPAPETSTSAVIETSTTAAPTTAAPEPTGTAGAVGSTGLPVPATTIPFTGAAAQATAAAGMVFAGAMAMLAAF